jgi:hypothetical protein
VIRNQHLQLKRKQQAGRSQRAFPFQHGRRGRFPPHPRIAPTRTQRNPRLRRQTAQAAKIGNSVIIIDAKSELGESGEGQRLEVRLQTRAPSFLQFLLLQSASQL